MLTMILDPRYPLPDRSRGHALRAQATTPDQVVGRHAGKSFSGERVSYLATKKQKWHKESKYLWKTHPL